MSQNIVRSAEVIGKKILSYENEDLGKIEEIVINKLSGKVEYIVLSFGGFLRFGEKLYAIPWNSISYDTEEESFRLDINKEKLDASSGFDKDNWPDFSDSQFIDRMSNNYIKE